MTLTFEAWACSFSLQSIKRSNAPYLMMSGMLSSLSASPYLQESHPAESGTSVRSTLPDVDLQRECRIVLKVVVLGLEQLQQGDKTPALHYARLVV